VSFQGTALREPAHFAAAIAIPHAGTWRLHGQQGIFADYQVGTLTVPGGLAVLRPPTPMTMHSDTHWGVIRPPDLAAMAKDTALPASTADRGAAAAPCRSRMGSGPRRPGTATAGCRHPWCLRSSWGWPPSAVRCCWAVTGFCGSHRGDQAAAHGEPAHGILTAHPGNSRCGPAEFSGILWVLTVVRYLRTCGVAQRFGVRGP
jgi:hypothetical protein